MSSSSLQQKSIFTSLKYVTKADVTVCSIMSVKICPAVFVHLLQFRTCAGGYALRRGALTMIQEQKLLANFNCCLIMVNNLTSYISLS